MRKWKEINSDRGLEYGERIKKRMEGRSKEEKRKSGKGRNEVTMK